MKNLMTPNISLAIVLSAAATVALRAAARRPEPRPVPGTEPAPDTVTARQSRPQTAVITGTQDDAGHEMDRPPGPPGRPASVAEQMRHVFHELHADGRNAVCVVCDSQYGPA
jgi:hypothetical protein